MRAMEITTHVLATLAGVVLLVGELGANGAPQEAAVASLAAAIAIIPYVITATMQRRELMNRHHDPRS